MGEDLHEIHVEGQESGVFIDDLSGEILDTKKLKRARKQEMKTCEDMKVYEYIRREDARSRGKIIGVRWVDTMKGELVKSRLVAQEFASDRYRDDMFAATQTLLVNVHCLQ